MTTQRTLENFIGGRSRGPTGGHWLDVIEPATGRVCARVADSGPEDVDAAVEAAASAFSKWSALPASERSRHLMNLADAIDRHVDELAALESQNTGKPLALARSMDIPRSAANLRFFATAILHTASQMHDFDGGVVPGSQGGVRALNYTQRWPRGVAGLISPWNLPLYLLTWKIGPALASGNTAVCKPSEVTPMTAARLGELAAEVGLPEGVLNIVHGTGARAGAALVTHPRVPTISFTGSTPVGRWIAREAGDRLKRVSLELGGKNPFVIFDDADVPAAIATATRAAFTNQGQICLCGSRLLVHRTIYDVVLAGLVERAKSLVIGDPNDSATHQGAVASAAHLAKIEAAVAKARELGGTIHTGGRRPDPAKLPERCRDGFFFEPTVISGLDPACSVEQEEIFGPVVTVQAFDDEEHAARLANGTGFGLAASIFTRDASRAHRFASKIDAGIVWVNCWLVRDLRTPFGGAKASGVGREGGTDALNFFTEPKNVCIAIDQESR